MDEKKMGRKSRKYAKRKEEFNEGRKKKSRVTRDKEVQAWR